MTRDRSADDSPYDVAPSITSGATAAAIDENSGAGQVVYTATSTDTGDIATGSTSYSLGGTDAGAFSIDSSTGAVTLTGNPNFEEIGRASCRERAYDAGQECRRQPVRCCAEHHLGRHGGSD